MRSSLTALFMAACAISCTAFINSKEAHIQPKEPEHREPDVIGYSANADTSLPFLPHRNDFSRHGVRTNLSTSIYTSLTNTFAPFQPQCKKQPH